MGYLKKLWYIILLWIVVGTWAKDEFTKNYKAREGKVDFTYWDTKVKESWSKGKWMIILKLLGFILVPCSLLIWAICWIIKKIRK